MLKLPLKEEPKPATPPTVESMLQEIYHEQQRQTKSLDTIKNIMVLVFVLAILAVINGSCQAIMGY